MIEAAAAHPSWVRGTELIRRHGIADSTYADAVQAFGEAGVVELTALVGYFTMACWVMNVAKTPGPLGSQVTQLEGFPA